MSLFFKTHLDMLVLKECHGFLLLHHCAFKAIGTILTCMSVHSGASKISLSSVDLKSESQLPKGIAFLYCMSSSKILSGGPTESKHGSSEEDNVIIEDNSWQ